MKPMLAKRYNDQIKNVEYPIYCQPKLNGVRALYNNQQFQSRDQKMWSTATTMHLVKELLDVPSHIVLDGEMYVHGWPLQKINGAMSVNRNEPNEWTPFVEYHVFDMIDTTKLSMPFSERTYNLEVGLARHPRVSVKFVDTHLVTSAVSGDQLFSRYKSLGYEGMMYRSDSPYGLETACGNQENRWAVLLKRKDWLDEDCLIVDVELGEGKYSNAVGSLVLVFPNGRTFRAGSGLSDMERLEYMDSPPIGRMAKIKYEMLSEDGVPLKPTVECVV